MLPAAPANEPHLHARLLAILAADVAGYSRLMALDDRATVAALDVGRAVFREEIAHYGGRVIDMAGDSVLAVFDTAAGAVNAALAVQRKIAINGASTPQIRRMQFRIGIHVGDVIEKADGTVYGDGVNIAARLEGLAEPGGLAVSQAVHGMVSRRVNAVFDDIGEQPFKHIAQPVRAYRLRSGALRFGRFELQIGERILLANGQPTALPANALDLLIALAERPGQFIGGQALVDSAWPGCALEDTDLPTSINTLRELFGTEVVTTVPGRGYRFTPPGDATASPAETASRTAATLPAPRGLRTNLHAELPALLGRSEDLASVGVLLERHRLVTIVGAGGTGKTRLAQALLVERRSAFTHGVCWVEMTSITDGTLLPGSIAAALGVQIGSGDPLAGLLAAVAPLTLLMALDNAEQVLTEVSLLAAALHEAAPGLRLVVTSQAPLKLACEQVYRLGALAVPQGPLPAAQALHFGAVALFTRCAQAADARFALTDTNASAVIELCRTLDGLPLAIELAAARAPMLGVQRLAASMRDRFKLLTSNRNRTAPARQQTLLATLEWSHSFLDKREAAVFRRLGVMVGSASLELIQQVVSDPDGTQAGQGVAGHGDLDAWAVLDVLGVLVDRSLVAVLNTDADLEISAATPPRYRLLESPRAYALERLAASGEQPALRQRHALAMAALFDAAWENYYGGSVGYEDWMHRLAPDLDNAREAFAWAASAGDTGSALAIAATLLRALPASQHAERMALADRCEALIGPAAPERLQQRAWAALCAQWGNTQKRRSHDAAIRALGLARALCAGADDAFPLYLVLCHLSKLAAAFGETDAVTAALDELQALEDPAWPPHRLIAGAVAQASIASSQGNVEQALRHTRNVVALDRARGANGTMSQLNLINSELAANDASAAARTGADLMATLVGTREEIGLAFARLNLTAAWLALGKVAQARVVAQAGWPQAARFEVQPYWADYLALLSALEGRPQTAARLAGFADAVYAARDERREPNEAAAMARTRALVRSAFSETESDRLHAEGAMLHDADIAALAFGSEQHAR